MNLLIVLVLSVSLFMPVEISTKRERSESTRRLFAKTLKGGDVKTYKLKRKKGRSNPIS